MFANLLRSFKIARSHQHLDMDIHKERGFGSCRYLMQTCLWWGVLNLQVNRGCPCTVLWETSVAISTTTKPLILHRTTATEGGSVQQRKDTEVAYDADLVVVACVHGGGMMEDNSNHFYKVWLFVHLLRKGNLYRGEKTCMKGERECYSLPSTDCSIALFRTALHHCLTQPSTTKAV